MPDNAPQAAPGGQTLGRPLTISIREYRRACAMLAKAVDLHAPPTPPLTYPRRFLSPGAAQKVCALVSADCARIITDDGAGGMSPAESWDEPASYDAILSDLWDATGAGWLPRVHDAAEGTP